MLPSRLVMFNVRCESCCIHFVHKYISEILCDSLDLACFLEFEARMRWFLGSQKARDSLDSESVHRLLPLLVPRGLSLDTLFAAHEPALAGLSLRGDLIAKLTKLMSASENDLTMKLKSLEFENFMLELRKLKLSELERRLFYSILELASIRPQLKNAEYNALFSIQRFLTFNEVIFV